MTHTLTITILSVMQVLSGPGCGVYLCIDKDGILSGVHGRAETCGCCSSSAEFSESPGEHERCEHRHDNQCCAIAGDFIPGSVDAATQEAELHGILPTGSLPCDCLHIPVTVPAAKVERAVRIMHMLARSRHGSHRDRDSRTQVLDPENSAVDGLSWQNSDCPPLQQHQCMVLRL